MRISPSQIKTFCASKSKRAGQYILKIKDSYPNDAFLLGQLFEQYLVTGKDMFEDIIRDKEVEDIEILVETYDNLKSNIGEYKFEVGKTQVKVEGQLFGCDVIGYIDNLTEERVEDIKTTRYLTKLDTTQKNMWSGMSTIDEYKLQLWIYCKLLGRKKARILEFSKEPPYLSPKTTYKKQIVIDMCKNFKEIDRKMKKSDIIEKYKPKKKLWQIIEFDFSDDTEMIEKYKPIVNEMISLYNKYKQ